jgi:UDP-N-acetylmuramoyl-tripeptide--D-alanyl-D-alanine ligase
MKLSCVAAACHGELHGEDVDFSSISIDTRTIQPGDVFVAIRGENFDGHDYIAAAKEAGASAVVAATYEPAYEPCLEVEDTRYALGKLAAAWLDQYSFKRIAVTGNAGKTTVKEMLACALGDKVLATQGNLNNDIGVPLTLFRCNEDLHYGVFELGANAPGEIAWTSSLVQADISLITNVTGAHLEGFGSMQGIADAKSEIFTGTKAGGTAIINDDDSFAEFFASQAIQSELKLVRVSASNVDADLYAASIRLGLQEVAFDLHANDQVFPVVLPLSGAHQVSNALMALAVVDVLGEDLSLAIKRLQAIKPVQGRMNLIDCDGGVLVDDSYNANPGSVKVAAKWLVKQSRPTAMVLGDLAELGPDAEIIMTDLGKALKQIGADKLIAKGDLAALAADSFGADGITVSNYHQAADAASDCLSQGGTVIVKGSRSAAMENVISILKNKTEQKTGAQG